MSELLSFGAAEAARRLRAREFSSTELVEAVLTRIEAVNLAVNAVRETLTDQAGQQARETDERLTAGTPSGPLDGLPVTVKDNVDVAGSATTPASLSGPAPTSTTWPRPSGSSTG